MNNVITLQQAIEMTTRFRENRDTILNPDYAGKNILPTSERFDRAAFDTLLAQPGCVGIRLYWGMTEALQVRAILVGVNQNDEDMLPASGSTAATTDGDDNVIVEEGTVCPPICPPDSPLNG